jgi:hypothetical protein
MYLPYSIHVSYGINHCFYIYSAGLAAIALPLVREAVKNKVEGFDIKTFKPQERAHLCENIAVCFIHGQDDDFVPPWQAQNVYELYGTGIPSSVESKEADSEDLSHPSNDIRDLSVSIASTTAPLSHSNESSKNSAFSNISESVSRSVKHENDNSNDTDSEFFSPEDPNQNAFEESSQSRSSRSQLNYELNKQLTGFGNVNAASNFYAQYRNWTPGYVSQFQSETKGGREKIFVLVEGGHNDIRPPIVLDRVAQFIFDNCFSKYEMDTYERAMTLMPWHVRDSKTSCAFLCKKFKRLEEVAEKENMTTKQKQKLRQKQSSSYETRHAAAYRLLSHDYYVLVIVHPTLGITLVAPWSGVTIGHYKYTELQQFDCIPNSKIVYFTLADEMDQNTYAFHCHQAVELHDLVSKNLDALLTIEEDDIPILVRKGAIKLVTQSLSRKEEVDVLDIIDTLMMTTMSSNGETRRKTSIHNVRYRSMDENQEMVTKIVCDVVQARTGVRPDVEQMKIDQANTEKASKRDRAVCCGPTNIDNVNGQPCVIS